MNVEIVINFSDDRLSIVTIAKPHGGEIVYRIVTLTNGIPTSIAEGLREAQRLFALAPWPGK